MSKPTHPLVPPEFTPEQPVILETPVLASATYAGTGRDLQKMVFALVTFCFIGLGSMFFTAKDVVGNTPWLAVLFLYPLAIAIAWKLLPNRSWRSCGLTLTEAGVVYHDQDFIHAYHWHYVFHPATGDWCSGAHTPVPVLRKIRSLQQATPL